jgi:membrane-associated phospholipid phosphatase
MADLALAAGLVGAQLLLYPIDDDVRAEVQGMRTAATDDVARIAEPLGRTHLWLAASAGTFLVGKLAREDRAADLGLHVFFSVAAAQAVTGALKGVAGRWRPRVERGDTIVLFHDPYGWRLFAGVDDDGRRAYPSGHASAAFAAATALSEELGGAAPWIAYPIATVVAWSRVHDDKHWASDVTMGALVGIFSARAVVRYGHRRGGPLERWLLLEVDAANGRSFFGLRAPVGSAPTRFGTAVAQ